ncbi:helix-turn-helix domain-containing protein [Acinetobacter baumannii]
MQKLLVGGKSKQLIATSISLFSEQGFHNIGIDTIVRESKVSKSTLYKHFKSKETMVEVSLYMNKQLLKEQVEGIIHQTAYSSVSDKLKQIYYLHADLESPYHLLLRAILEIKGTYPNAFDMVVKYRTWLVNTVHLLLTESKPSADCQDAHMFLFVIDGGLTQLLNSSMTTERDILLNYFLLKITRLHL